MDRETTPFTLPSGAEIEIETLPDAGRGTRDVAARRGGPELLEEALTPLKEVVELVLGQLRGLQENVDSVSIELGASFKGGAKLVLVQGEVGSTLKVTVTWKRPE